MNLLDLLNLTIVRTMLAVEPVLAQTRMTSWRTFAQGPTGKWLIRLVAILGLIIVIAGMLRAGEAMLRGQVGQALRLGFALLFFGALLFDPMLIVRIFEFLGDLVGQIFRNAGQAADGVRRPR